MRTMLPVTALFIAGCSVSAPVTGSLSTGEPIGGVARAGLGSGGTVEVSGSGMSCRGTYDAYSLALLLSVPLTCGGGVTGMAQVEREPDMTGGTGSFTLSDGRSGTFRYNVE